MKYNFYSDPSHGWLKVQISKLKELGIHKAISHYSYMRGEWAFLEEDVDAPIFMSAMKSAGIPVEIKECHANNRSRIRNYQSYAD